MKIEHTIEDLDELEKVAQMLENDYVNQEWSCEREFVNKVIGVIHELKSRIQDDQRRFGRREESPVKRKARR